MTTHQARCRLCKKPVPVRYDGEGNVPIPLLEMVTCNRCYDLLTKRGDIEDTIRRITTLIYRTRCFGGKSNEAVFVACRANLIEAVRQYADVVAEFYHAQPILDDTLAGKIFNNPNNWMSLVNKYRRDVFAKIKAAK